MAVRQAFGSMLCDGASTSDWQGAFKCTAEIDPARNLFKNGLRALAEQVASIDEQRVRIRGRSGRSGFAEAITNFLFSQLQQIRCTTDESGISKIAYETVT